MHITECGPIAVLFELKIAPLGPRRAVLHYEDFDELLNKPLCTSDLREEMQIKPTKEEVPWQVETSVMCWFQSDQLPESALTAGQRLWHSDENPSVALGGASREIPGCKLRPSAPQFESEQGCNLNPTRSQPESRINCPRSGMPSSTPHITA
jgi:hypothetical protein